MPKGYIHENKKAAAWDTVEGPWGSLGYGKQGLKVIPGGLGYKAQGWN